MLVSYTGEEVVQRKSIWCGHVLTQEVCPAQLLTMAARRDRGRPILRWEDNVTKWSGRSAVDGRAERIGD